MSTVLKIDALDKSYGRVHALKQLSLEVNAGEVFGFLGPNGSGKTTTLAILHGIVKKDRGSFSWFGNGEDDANRMNIGALLETPNFYPYLSAYQNLKIAALIKKMDNYDSAINRVIERVGLKDRAHDKFRQYSLGMKQRLAIASALLSDPDVLVLDEPTNGLDPQGIADIRDLVADIAKDGKTIIIASHILDEIEKICSHVAILRHGELLNYGSLEHILGGKTTTLIASDNLKELILAVESIEWAKMTRNTGKELMVDLGNDKTPKDLNKALFNKGIVLNELRSDKKNLESIFLETVTQ